MTIRKYLKHPIVPTELGRRVLRARLSLRETQKEFAERMRVSNITIYNWENGRTERINKIHREMLDTLIKQLKAGGIYMPDEAFQTVYRTQMESRGNALA